MVIPSLRWVHVEEGVVEVSEGRVLVDKENHFYTATHYHLGVYCGNTYSFRWVLVAKAGEGATESQQRASVG